MEAGHLTQKDGTSPLLPISQHTILDGQQDGYLISTWITAGSITGTQAAILLRLTGYLEVT